MPPTMILVIPLILNTIAPSETWAPLMAHAPKIVYHTADGPHDNGLPSGSSAGNQAWLPRMDICSGHFGIANATDSSVLLLLLVSLPGPGDQLLVRHGAGSQRVANPSSWTSLPLEPGSYGVPHAREKSALSHHPFLANMSLDVGLFSLSNSTSFLSTVIEIEERHHVEEAPLPTLYGVVYCRADGNGNGSFIESLFEYRRRKTSRYPQKSASAAQPRKLLGVRGAEKLHGHHQQQRRLDCKKRSISAAAAVAVGLALLVSLLCPVAGFCLFRCKRKLLLAEERAPILRSGLCSSGPRRYSHRELAAATGGFSEKGKIGRGGFGPVYHGYLRDEDCHLAVKVLSQESSVQGTKEFETEVKVMSRLRHRNIVRLLGWCDGPRDLLLVYEFMFNGSLDKHLYSSTTCRTLTWSERYNIALGVGSAILYLHTECEHCVVHGDIKPANIMLNSSFQAKLGDFGLARLLEHGAVSQTTQVVAGTLGYIDPEFVKSRRPSTVSDVYSFGIVLLETACGRRPASSGGPALVHWVHGMHRHGSVLGAVDTRLDGKFDEWQVERVLVTGLWCAHQDPSQRPSITQAMDVLRREDAELPAIIAPEMHPVADEVRSLEARAFGVDSSGEESYGDDKSPAETEYHTSEEPTLSGASITMNPLI